MKPFKILVVALAASFLLAGCGNGSNDRQQRQKNEDKLLSNPMPKNW